MGSPISQVGSSTQPQGKGGYQAPRPLQQNNFNEPSDATQELGAERWMQFQQSIGQAPSGNLNQAGSSAVQQTSQLQAPNGAVNDMAGANQLMGQAAQGKGSRVTYPGQGGQPKMGQPNMYPNTVGQWDNASIQPQQSLTSGGKGKG